MRILYSGCGDLARCFDAVQGGHSHIHQDHIGRMTLCHGHCLMAIGGGSYHLGVICLLENHPQTGPDEGVVVRQDNANHVAGSRGMWPSTLNPPPAVGPTENSSVYFDPLGHPPQTATWSGDSSAPVSVTLTWRDSSTATTPWLGWHRVFEHVGEGLLHHAIACQGDARWHTRWITGDLEFHLQTRLDEPIAELRWLIEPWQGITGPVALE